MKKNLILAGLVLISSGLNSLFSTARAQGNLTPPGAPAPIMKTLAQIEPRTAISSLPLTISSPGSFYLTTNLTYSGAGNGITVSSGNVTIDLNGFTLQGTSGAGAGIAVSTTYTNLVFRNGTVTGWGGNGIDSYSSGFPRNILIEKITVSANLANGVRSEAGSIIRDCLAFGNGASGFNSAGGQIIGCVSRNNSTAGFAMVNGLIINCQAEYNTGYGFSLNSARAVDCDCVYNSSYGFDCNGVGDEIVRCRVANNLNYAIAFEASATGTAVEDCQIANNQGFGIYSFAGGGGGGYIVRNNFISLNNTCVWLNDNNNYLEGNHILTGSGSFGIHSSGTNNVVVRNVVAGAGVYNYNPNVDDFGPAGSASSLSSPWGNVSH